LLAGISSICLLFAEWFAACSKRVLFVRERILFSKWEIMLKLLLPMKGPGLAISFLIVKKYEGHISIQIAEGRGSSFEIYLPASGEKVIPK
jgi:hypothetical protein